MTGQGFVVQCDINNMFVNNRVFYKRPEKRCDGTDQQNIGLLFVNEGILLAIDYFFMTGLSCSGNEKKM